MQHPVVTAPQPSAANCLLADVPYKDRRHFPADGELIEQAFAEILTQLGERIL